MLMMIMVMVPVVQLMACLVYGGSGLDSTSLVAVGHCLGS